MHTLNPRWRLSVAGRLPLHRALSGRTQRGSVGTAARYFIPVWFLLAAINMWKGMARAGYTFRDEFPIFLLVCATRRRSASRTLEVQLTTPVRVHSIPTVDDAENDAR